MTAMEAWNMAFERIGHIRLHPEAVREGAPTASGVYAIFTPERWCSSARAMMCGRRSSNI